ncbi:peroxin 14 17 [Ophiostoma piceae UAMH 11346]|uniref:Peroxisomal membrane protein PEX14 n=1 Tax=Ophiostoma piceae (strain UAMH 11346) TaxID=1262450 RepID=S3C4N3_OPHP1|nr:peroxin 14 17 [Ophiostoma piceae UAMH 11346]
MSDTDPKDEPSSASAPETHDTLSPPSSDGSSLSSASQADTPSQTESQEVREPQDADTQEPPSSESESESLPPTPSSSSSPDAPPTLDQARAFLRDPVVLRETPARKAAFLAAKGLSGKEIDLLLKEVADEEQPQAQESTAAAVAAPAAPATLPPIVTYPEFVANASPQPPPPLVTPQVLAAALYGTAATSSLLYAAAKLVLAPMVDALTEARTELHETAGSNLAALTEKLESIVSVVPPSLSAAAADKKEDVNEVEIDDASSASSYDDPTEVFHRDIGVQTSLPPSPVLPPTVTMDSTVPNLATGLSLASAPPPTASQLQADRLASLVESVRALSQGWVGSTDLHTEIKTTVEVFREDVDKLSRPPAFTYGGGGSGSGGMYNYGSAISGTGGSGTSGTKYPGYVTTTRNEPDDEIRKAKENIRRVKGALLSTRTFPTAR